MSPAPAEPTGNRLRLLLFTPAFSERGGIARRSRLLTAGLTARGWHVTVLARTSSWWFRVTRAPNLLVVEVPGYPLHRTGTLLYLAFALPMGLVFGGRASVLASIKLFSTSSAAAVCAWLTRRPLVALATTSGGAGEVAELLARDTLGLRTRRALLGRAAVLVAQTPTGAVELARLVPAGRTAVVPTPVELVDAPDLTGEPRVLFAGRLSRDKDLTTLLTAWRSVVAGHPEATLALVGEGGSFDSVEAELRDIVEGDEALRRSVRFTGWLGDVGPMLAESDVFVLPSLDLQEGMSNALVEACAWGRVVVATDIPANRAVLGEDYPLLFPPGDATALAEAVDRALFDECMRRAARSEALGRAQRFRVEAVAALLDDVLRAARSGLRVPDRG